MSEKQNPGLENDDSLPGADEQPCDHNGSPPESYYYDDATGYEIYKEESDDDEDESSFVTK